MNTCRTCKYRDLDKFVGTNSYFCSKLSNSVENDNLTTNFIYLILKNCTCEEYKQLESIQDAIDVALDRIGLILGWDSELEAGKIDISSFSFIDNVNMSEHFNTKSYQEYQKIKKIQKDI